MTAHKFLLNSVLFVALCYLLLTGSTAEYCADQYAQQVDLQLLQGITVCTGGECNCGCTAWSGEGLFGSYCEVTGGCNNKPSCGLCVQACLGKSDTF